MGQAIDGATRTLGIIGWPVRHSLSPTIHNAAFAALGLPMVVVPYPHAAGHQRANARVLVEAGGASFVEDEDFDAEALLEAAEILHDPARHAAMSAASRALGRPGAAAAVARLVLAIADRRPLPDGAEVDRLSRGAQLGPQLRSQPARDAAGRATQSASEAATQPGSEEASEAATQADADR